MYSNMYKYNELEKLLQLLFHPQIVGMSALLFATILRTRMQSRITFTTNHLVAIVLLCQQTQTRLNHATSQSQHQMQSGLLLDIVIAQSTTVFQLFTSEDQALLIRRNSFFILNLCFDVIDGITWLDLKGDGLTCQGFYKDLHA